MARLETLQLPSFLKKAFLAGHPWIYRDHVPPAFSAESGATLRVVCEGHERFGVWDQGSPLCLRLFPGREQPGRSYVAYVVRRAFAERASIREQHTTAYRWLSGEGDGLPGIVADLYAGFVVLALDTEAVSGMLPWVVEGLTQTAQDNGLNLRGILLRRRGSTAGAELLWGTHPPAPLVVEEHGLKLLADLVHGQKTGLFLDHRENRKFLEAHAAGARVLNLYGYTGAFSLYAVRAGARRVVHVDRAAAAVEAAQENFRLNGFDPTAHAFVVADVERFLEQHAQTEERFEVVICDPPSMARSRAQRARAIAAYTRINALALQLTTEEALLASASCTTQVGVDAFHELLNQAGVRASCLLRILHEAGHASDHPILGAHPEGRYLKFVVLRASRLGTPQARAGE